MAEFGHHHLFVVHCFAIIFLSEDFSTVFTTYMCEVLEQRAGEGVSLVPTSFFASTYSSQMALAVFFPYSRIVILSRAELYFPFLSSVPNIQTAHFIGLKTAPQNLILILIFILIGRLSSVHRVTGPTFW